MSGTLVLASGFAGIAGWATAEFCARPVRDFLRLRTAVRSLIVILLDLPPATQPPSANDDQRAVSPAVIAGALRDLGAQLLAFGETEIAAAMAMEWLGFDAVKAGQLLIALAAAREGSERNACVAGIEEALRLARSAAAVREERVARTSLLAGRR